MGVATFQRFEPSVETQMRNVYQTLSEEDQRGFAAIQARQLGHGGSRYIADVLGCSTGTIRRGMNELDTLETVTDLMRKATTSTGLRTTVNVIRHLYETGRNATAAMKEQIRSTVNFAELIPKWNYTITPQRGQ